MEAAGQELLNISVIARGSGRETLVALADADRDSEWK